jgi:anti-sigma B factor antagonist
MSLTIEVEKLANGSLIRVMGEVDLYSSPELRTTILKVIPKAAQHVSVDLSGVEYIDSSGIATLVEGLRSAREHDKKFILVSPSPGVMQVLELARLDRIFELRPAT